MSVIIYDFLFCKIAIIIKKINIFINIIMMAITVTSFIYRALIIIVIN